MTQKRLPVPSGRKLRPSKHKQVDSIGQMSYTKPINQQLAEWRLRLKLTQRQLATELGVNERTLYRYERGLHRPHPLFLAKVQEWLAEARAAEFMVQESLQTYGERVSRIAPPISGSDQAHLQT